MLVPRLLKKSLIKVQLPSSMSYRQTDRQTDRSHNVVPSTPSLQDLNDEAVLETVDFSEFEAMFQVKRFEKGKKQLKREESES